MCPHRSRCRLLRRRRPRPLLLGKNATSNAWSAPTRLRARRSRAVLAHCPSARLKGLVMGGQGHGATRRPRRRSPRRTLDKIR